MQALDHDLRGYCHCIAGREVPGGLAQVTANTLKVCVGTGSIPLPEAGLELASIVHLVASHLAACAPAWFLRGRLSAKRMALLCRGSTRLLRRAQKRAKKKTTTKTMGCGCSAVRWPSEG